MGTNWGVLNIEAHSKVINFVIPVVFNKLRRVECMYWSNKTVFDVRDMYRNLLHKVQLHVSTLDNGHFQVVH